MATAVTVDVFDILSDELLLLRAGLLPDDERTYYRSRPEKWKRELVIARRLEAEMIRAGVEPVEGWQMSVRELCERRVRFEESNTGESK